MTRSVMLLSLGLMWGCGTTEPLDQLVLAIAFDPPTVAQGDSVHFVASAYNPTDERVRLGTQCGPSFDVLVTRPDGEEVSVLLERVGPDAAFICLETPQHSADPGETEELTLAWLVPDVPGQYEAVAVLRRPGPYSSSPVQFVVP
jgi:hypothetical protein